MTNCRKMVCGLTKKQWKKVVSMFSMRKARDYASTQAVGKCCSVFWDILGHFYALVFEH